MREKVSILVYIMNTVTVKEIHYTNLLLTERVKHCARRQNLFTTTTVTHTLPSSTVLYLAVQSDYVIGCTWFRLPGPPVFQRASWSGQGDEANSSALPQWREWRPCTYSTIRSHNKLHIISLVPRPHPPRGKGSGAPRVLLWAWWHGVSKFYNANQNRSMRPHHHNWLFCLTFLSNEGYATKTPCTSH